MEEVAKTCVRCGATSLLRYFPPDKRNKDGRRGTCYPCARQYYNSRKEKNNTWRREYRKRKPEKYYIYNLKRYGLDWQAYQDLLAAHNYCCKICQKTTDLQVDHCHTRNVVRGILCGGCNRTLAVIEKYKNEIPKFIQYVEESYVK